MLGNCSPIEESAVYGCSDGAGPGLYGVRGTCIDPLTDNAAIIGHTKMIGNVFVQSAAEFADWQKQQLAEKNAGTADARPVSAVDSRS